MSSKAAPPLHDTDFVAWTRVQARELRRFARLRPNVALDLRHIAAEIADLGTERRDALRSCTRRIIEHLLLLQHSPAREPRHGWIDEVEALRDEIEERLTRSLRRDLQHQLPRLYGRARDRAQGKLARYGEAGAAQRLPESCPYALDEILGDFWPPADPSAS
jgi:hypothetical protein